MDTFGWLSAYRISRSLFRRVALLFTAARDVRAYSSFHFFFHVESLLEVTLAVAFLKVFENSSFEGYIVPRVWACVAVRMSREKFRSVMCINNFPLFSTINFLHSISITTKLRSLIYVMTLSLQPSNKLVYK